MKPILALVVPFLVALALGISLILAFGLTPRFLPLYGAIPSSAEATVRVNTTSGTVCGPKNHSTTPATAMGLVGVSPSPTAVTADWIPGLDSTSCRGILTQGDQAIAGALTTAIDKDPTVTPGTYMCPNDTGTSVTLYFNYGNVNQGEIVDVDLEGCPWIGDPERGGRWWLDNPKADDAFGSSLVALAPPGWRAYVKSIIHHDFSGSPSKEP